MACAERYIRNLGGPSGSTGSGKEAESNGKAIDDHSGFGSDHSR